VAQLSTLGIMRFLTHHYVAVFAVSLFIIGCSRPIARSGAPDGARLTTNEVVHIAKEMAVSKSIRLSDFYEPEVSYKSTNMSWFVFFKGRALIPGNFFTVDIDDQTKKTRYAGGE
jgi:hypothetical protein